DLLWQDLAAADPALAEWCSDRWLAAWRRLGPVPENLASTRLALHRLAERVISPARSHANGKIGLRFTRGGFGTPFFAQDVQVRVEGTTLVVDSGSEERRAPITSLAAAAVHLGPNLLPDDDALDGETLDVDPAAASFLGEWYGF